MTHQLHHRSRMRVRRLGAAVVLATVAWTSLSSAEAGASRRTKSAAVAAEAARAADALERWTTSQSPSDYVRFVQSRDLAAALTEAEIELDGGVLSRAWASAPLTKQHAVLNAISQLGVPYKNIASEPGVGFDCSGLTIWAYGDAGVEIPRVSRQQIRAADPIDREDAEPGDLVYYPGHVSIFLGAGLMVHSPNSGSHVEIAPLSKRSLRFGDAVGATVEFVAPPAL